MSDTMKRDQAAARKPRGKRDSGDHSALPSRGRQRALARLEAEVDVWRDAYDHVHTALLNLSERLVSQTVPEESIKAALEAFRQAPEATRRSIMGQPHPYECLIAWHSKGLH
jgi:hypothetical protein